MLAQLLALGSSAGLEASLISRFPDATLDSLVGADGVHEFALAVVSLGSVAPALALSGAAVGEGSTAISWSSRFLHRRSAGCLRTWGEPWSPGEPTETSEVGPTVEEVVLRRGSQRLMDPTRGLPRSLLTTSMEVARRGIDLPHWVVVHDVECVAPGLYRWPDLATPLRDGTLRDELYRAGCDQGLPRDALRRGVGDPHRRPRRPWLPRGAARRGPGRGPAAAACLGRRSSASSGREWTTAEPRSNHEYSRTCAGGYGSDPAARPSRVQERKDGKHAAVMVG